MSSTTSATIVYGFKIDDETIHKIEEMSGTCGFRIAFNGDCFSGDLEAFFGKIIHQKDNNDITSAFKFPVDLEEEVRYRLRDFCADKGIRFKDPELFLILSSG